MAALLPRLSTVAALVIVCTATGNTSAQEFRPTAAESAALAHFDSIGVPVRDGKLTLSGHTMTDDDWRRLENLTKFMSACWQAICSSEFVGHVSNLKGVC